MSAKTYRVVQWATGNIGTKSLRAVIEHPNLELVGLYVHSPDKAGKDAGELCGAGITGVIATNSLDDILALGADCVLYMQQGCDLDDVCRILDGAVVDGEQEVAARDADGRRRRAVSDVGGHHAFSARCPQHAVLDLAERGARRDVGRPETQEHRHDDDRQGRP